MENFGAVLKDIRISKNFRLKDLSCNEISESTISRFENGITKLSINHFYILLNRLANLPYNSSKCNELIKYLLSVDTWMEYELKLFYNSVFFMNTKTISLLYRIVIKKTRHF